MTLPPPTSHLPAIRDRECEDRWMHAALKRFKLGTGILGPLGLAVLSTVLVGCSSSSVVTEACGVNPASFGPLPSPTPLTSKPLAIQLPLSEPRFVVVVQRGQRFQLVSTRAPKPPISCAQGILRSGQQSTRGGGSSATFIAMNVGWAEVVTSVPVYGGSIEQPVPTTVLIEVRPTKT